MHARPVARATAAAAFVAGALWLLFGGGSVNYDAAYGLLWGDQVAHGSTPEFVVPLAPTPKPLALILGLVLTPLGDDAATGLRAFSFPTLGGLAVAAFACAAAAGGRRSGVLSACLVLTSVPLLSFGTRGYLDVLFVALALAAAWSVARDAPDHHAAVALAVGGLIRPEAWALAAAHVLWIVWRDGRVPRVVLAVAASPVAAWLLCDLVVTGDPLWSLTGTRANVEALGRDTGLGALVTTEPRRIGEIVREPVLAGGVLATLVLGRPRPDRQTAALVALGAVSVVSFAGLVLAGSPVIGRYLLLPSVVLIVLVSGAVGRVRPGDGPAVLLTAAAVLGVTVLAAPAQVDRLTGVRASLRAQRAIERDLETIARAADRFDACRPITVEGHRQVPVVARELGARATAIRLYRGPTEGLVILAATDRIRRLAALDRSVRPMAGGEPGASWPVATTPSWVLLKRC